MARLKVCARSVVCKVRVDFTSDNEHCVPRACLADGLFPIFADSFMPGRATHSIRPHQMRHEQKSRDEERAVEAAMKVRALMISGPDADEKYRCFVESYPRKGEGRGRTNVHMMLLLRFPLPSPFLLSPFPKFAQPTSS